MAYEVTCNAITDLLRSIDTNMMKISKQHYAGFTLTPPQISILLLIRKKGAMKVSELARELNMVDSNASAICSRLEKADLIERTRYKEDQRIVKIQLTKTALANIEEIAANAKRLEEFFASQVSQQDMNDIILGLTKLNLLLALSIEEEHK